jgi:hypothetical protein
MKISIPASQRISATLSIVAIRQTYKYVKFTTATAPQTPEKTDVDTRECNKNLSRPFTQYTSSSLSASSINAQTQHFAINSARPLFS